MTKAEKEHQSLVRDLGCIACLVSNGLRTDCDIHHILRGGKRISEMHVLGLCPSHHRSELNNAQIVSRHHWKREFERRYGTEAELLAETRRLVVEQQRRA